MTTLLEGSFFAIALTRTEPAAPITPHQPEVPGRPGGAAGGARSLPGREAARL
jgi:hypothetical protein